MSGEKKQAGRPADYGDATPEDVAKAVLTHRPRPTPTPSRRQP